MGSKLILYPEVRDAPKAGELNCNIEESMLKLITIFAFFILSKHL